MIEKVHRWETPNRGGEKEVHVPNTSNSSHGTATDKARHHRNCSSRTFFIDLYGGSHKTFMQELPMEHPRITFMDDQSRAWSGSSCKDISRRIPTKSPQDLLTRPSSKSCENTRRIWPGTLQELLTGACTRPCKGLWQTFTRIVKTSPHKEL